MVKTYKVASIINYIDIFISKFNRLNIQKTGWHVPLKISGVKKLDFSKDNDVLKAMMQHQITKTLSLQIIIELKKNKNGFDQFTLNASSIEVKLPNKKDNPTNKQLGVKQEWNDEYQQVVTVTPLKRYSLSYFYGNQMAVDVCRYMYVCINKIMNTNFDINLQTVVYKIIPKTARQLVGKKQCIVQPSFKVYLGVNQITNMILKSTQLMKEHRVTSTKALLQKLKNENKKNASLNESMIPDLPQLKRRDSFLLTPITMEENGREMLAVDYDGTEEYQNAIRKLYGDDYKDFLDQDFENIKADDILDQRRKSDKWKQSQKVPTGTVMVGMTRKSSEKDEITELLKRKMQLDLKRKVLADKVPNQEVSIDKELFKNNMSEASESYSFSHSNNSSEQKELHKKRSSQPSDDNDEFEMMMEEDINKKNINLELLENLIEEAANQEKYASILKIGRKTRSESSVPEMRREMDLKERNKAFVLDKLGVDLDEDKEFFDDEDNKKKLENLVKNEFVFLRLAPIQSVRISRLSKFLAPTNKLLNLECDNKLLLKKNKSEPNPKVDFDTIEKQELKESLKRQKEITVPVIGEQREIKLNVSEKVMNVELVKNDDSEASNFQEEILVVEDQEELSNQTVKVIYSDSDPKYNTNTSKNIEQGNPIQVGDFTDNSKLTPEQKRDMVSKIIEIKAYIDKNDIKCDFQVYNDYSYYMDLPDEEVAETLPKVRKIMESATQNRLPLARTSSIILVNDKTGDQMPQEQYQELVQQKADEDGTEYTEAEIEFSLEGYTQEQIEELMILFSNDEAFMNIGGGVTLSMDNQEKLDKVHLLKYDITEILQSDLKNVE